MSQLIDVHVTNEIVWTLVKGELCAWRVEVEGLTRVSPLQALAAVKEDDPAMAVSRLKPL